MSNPFSTDDGRQFEKCIAATAKLLSSPRRNLDEKRGKVEKRRHDERQQQQQQEDREGDSGGEGDFTYEYNNLQHQLAKMKVGIFAELGTFGTFEFFQ